MSLVFNDIFLDRRHHPWPRRSVWGLILSCLASLSIVHAYEEIPVPNGGRIVGHVKFTGVVPLPKQLEISKDQEVCGRTEKFDQSLIVGAGMGLRNVVVALLDIRAGKKFAEERTVVDQRDCLYTPHVVVTPAGQPLSFLNNDGILHSLHTHSMRNPAFNKAQSKFKKEVQETFSFSEIIKLTCDVHSWMLGWIVVSEHPYYAVSGADGFFELTDIPEGKYQLSFWHEILGEKKEIVDVKEGSNLEVDVDF